MPHPYACCRARRMANYQVSALAATPRHVPKDNPRECHTCAHAHAKEEHAGAYSHVPGHVHMHAQVQVHFICRGRGATVLRRPAQPHAVHCTRILICSRARGAIAPAPPNGARAIKTDGGCNTDQARCPSRWSTATPNRPVAPYTKPAVHREHRRGTRQSEWTAGSLGQVRQLSRASCRSPRHRQACRPHHRSALGSLRLRRRTRRPQRARQPAAHAAASASCPRAR